MTNGEQAQTYEHMPVQYEEKSNRLFCLHQTELTPYHHFHSHVELVCKHSGETRVFADKQSATLRAGDLFWAFPNQIHYYQDISPGENTVLLVPEQYYQDYRHLLYHYAPKEPCIRNFLQTQRYAYLWEQILSDQYGGSSSFYYKGLSLRIDGGAVTSCRIATGQCGRF